MTFFQLKHHAKLKQSQHPAHETNSSRLLLTSQNYFRQWSVKNSVVPVSRILSKVKKDIYFHFMNFFPKLNPLFTLSKLYLTLLYRLYPSFTLSTLPHPSLPSLSFLCPINSTSPLSTFSILPSTFQLYLTLYYLLYPSFTLSTLPHPSLPSLH